MDIRNEIIEPDTFYHIYNRGINSCSIFQNEQNRLFFLSKFSHYLNEICEVYTYCLMPNHFHFLVKIKSKETLLTFAEKHAKSTTKKESGLHSFPNVFSKQIGKFISCYSQSYNKVNNRHGALLESPYKRLKIDSDDYLKNLIVYIHLNRSDSEQNFDTFKFSSYLAILSTNKTNIKREEVIAIFENLENFIYCHRYPPKTDFSF
jgi:REP element-mobilizing transposase RayT